MTKKVNVQPDHGHISYILEANSKRPIREKKIRKRIHVEEMKWNGVIFFLF